MIAASAFLAACRARGWTFFSGTPCSYLKPLINAAIDDPATRFCDATNEGDAVAMAAGATVATGAPGVVMFQNSGLGNAVNALTSLNWPFRLPTLVVVTHRGEPGGPADEPQHELMGEITGPLLSTLRIAWEPFPTDAGAIDAALNRAQAHFATQRLPYALVMPHGAVAEHALRTEPAMAAGGRRELSFTEELGADPTARPARAEALAALLAAKRPGDVLIATTGYTGRELFTLQDAPEHLYLVGSMGSASAFGLGLALQRPERRVFVVDGDGAALMRLGNLASVGAHAPRNFCHLLLDNEAHESTGGQATVSAGVSFGAIAQACGYRAAVGTDRLAVLRSHLAAQTVEAGPTLLHLRIRRGTLPTLGRPKIAPAEVARRLTAYLGR
jgi:phosphonopyruvate decarboxylase